MFTFPVWIDVTTIDNRIITINAILIQGLELCVDGVEIQMIGKSYKVTHTKQEIKEMVHLESYIK